MKRYTIKVLQFILCFIFPSSFANAQASYPNTKEEKNNLIAASQKGSTPLFFEADDPKATLISPDLKIVLDKEFTIRGGIPNFFNKIKSGNTVRVGYIGGSITQGDNMYRNQSAKYIQNMFPETKIVGINAGVSGTGTDLGACRVYEQLLQYKPDLIFIEFAVNGAYKNGMEGMIRQIVRYDPNIDICLLYSIGEDQVSTYLNFEVPAPILGLETLAAHYNLPSIHLGLNAAFLMQSGALIWKAEKNTLSDKILFSYDGLHPSPDGGNVYASAIARALESFRNEVVPVKHILPTALIEDNWEDAKMYDPALVAEFDTSWKTVHSASSHLKQFAEWFPNVMMADRPGQSITIKFNGKGFGFFDIGGPEVGQVEIVLDGKMINIDNAGGRIKKLVLDNYGTNLINRFNHYCNNRYRGQYEFFSVEPGLHTVRITVSSVKADKKAILGPWQLSDINSHFNKYDRTVFYLGKILIRGEIIQ